MLKCKNRRVCVFVHFVAWTFWHCQCHTYVLVPKRMEASPSSGLKDVPDRTIDNFRVSNQIDEFPVL